MCGAIKITNLLWRLQTLLSISCQRLTCFVSIIIDDVIIHYVDIPSIIVLPAVFVDFWRGTVISKHMTILSLGPTNPWYITPITLFIHQTEIKRKHGKRPTTIWNVIPVVSTSTHVNYRTLTYVWIDLKNSFCISEQSYMRNSITVGNQCFGFSLCTTQGNHRERSHNGQKYGTGKWNTHTWN